MDKNDIPSADELIERIGRCVATIIEQFQTQTKGGMFGTDEVAMVLQKYREMQDLLCNLSYEYTELTAEQSAHLAQIKQEAVEAGLWREISEVISRYFPAI